MVPYVDAVPHYLGMNAPMIFHKDITMKLIKMKKGQKEVLQVSPIVLLRDSLFEHVLRHACIFRFVFLPDMNLSALTVHIFLNPTLSDYGGLWAQNGMIS